MAFLRRIPKVLLAFLLLVVSLVVSQQHTDETTTTTTTICTVCRNGTNVGFLPDKVPFDVGILAGQTCAEINRAVGILHPDVASEECQTIQSMGVLCGCPTDAQNTCSVCPDKDSIMTEPDRELPFLEGLVEGILVPTCETLQAYFWSTHNSAEDGMCTVAHEYMADYCGCTQPEPTTTSSSSSSSLRIQVEKQPCSLCLDSNDVVSLPDRDLSMDGFPFETCSELQYAARTLLTEDSIQCASLKGMGEYCGCPVAAPNAMVEMVEEPCTFCPDGSPVRFPDKPFPRLLERFGGFTPSCGMVESSLVLLEKDSDTCRAMQGMSSICGCAPVQDHCRYCDEWGDDYDMPQEYANQPIPLFLDTAAAVGEELTCQEAFYSQFQIGSTDDRCHRGRANAWQCGCNGGARTYMHADTMAKKKVLAWFPCLTGTLSIVGSLAVMLDLLATRTRGQVRSKIVFAMSLSDIPASIATVLSTLPTPKDRGIYGAMGNATSCAAQGFFLQFSVLVLFYHLSLSTYFYLSLAKEWSEWKIRGYQFWILGIPLVCGLVLAFAAIPQITEHCQSDGVTPDAPTWYPIFIFWILPNLTATILSTAMMGVVCTKVRQQARRMCKWRFPLASKRRKSRAPTIDRRIFWQAILYLSVYYITHSVQLFLLYNEWWRPSHHATTARRDVYAAWVLFVVFVPLQGFWNAFLYFRRRCWQRARDVVILLYSGCWDPTSSEKLCEEEEDSSKATLSTENATPDQTGNV